MAGRDETETGARLMIPKGRLTELWRGRRAPSWGRCWPAPRPSACPASVTSQRRHCAAAWPLVCRSGQRRSVLPVLRHGPRLDLGGSDLQDKWWV